MTRFVLTSVVKFLTIVVFFSGTMYVLEMLGDPQAFQGVLPSSAFPVASLRARCSSGAASAGSMRSCSMRSCFLPTSLASLPLFVPPWRFLAFAPALTSLHQLCSCLPPSPLASFPPFPGTSHNESIE